MPSFNDAELSDFLTENANIMRLSTLEPGGHPYVTPVWFEYIDGIFNILGRKQNKWVMTIIRCIRIGSLKC